MILHLGSVHGSVEVVEVLVLEVRVINEVPLSTRVVVAVAVALARKVQPFRVAKLVACTMHISNTHARMHARMHARTRAHTHTPV